MRVHQIRTAAKVKVTERSERSWKSHHPLTNEGVDHPKYRMILNCFSGDKSNGRLSVLADRKGQDLGWRVSPILKTNKEGAS